MKELFNDAIYQPLYNALTFLISIVPFGDVGMAVILLTIVVKVLILPLSNKALISQVRMREIEPEVRKLKEKYGDNREELAKRTLELYREKKINPFSGCLPLLIQLPILMGLYFVFFKESGAVINPDLLYSFIHVPDPVTYHFLGLIDISQKSLILALLAGFAQYIHTKMSLQAPAPRSGDGKVSFSDEFARSMHIQMKYVFPIMITGIAFITSGVIALYFIVSSVFAIAHELVMKRTRTT
ncbi:MAG: hypothetical protein A2408_03685 [Candidatus Yonathbacteria bacterium RIFOXYC1_FULL_52_10]|uniref:Membrane insertase YidC/Oxa/ALB C-terminal domain-containing protein n=1 Tax=Candidatus Yonathbacteria bacterium RIFOXYD1_FULL_52_36 TaxID=1802730 RepID=A0A1G2SJW2_9BACT|nr:MAG: hypothetical protein A2591_00380 [Candidatus Yonathbacteria bacterium RIFOXYD1_FULL_52_36]OHA85285.1 MAG: hypothetical protein A2408_03685 [Candidatus Yonathbacteria bacterium RIFOXYC1_FULL_52_10]